MAEKHAGGRPKKKIDYETAEKLAAIMCTQEEIASIMDVSVRTLQRDEEFCRVYKKGIDTAKMSLRRKQLAMSDSNPTMAIWLGKQYLGQKDKQDIEHSGETTVNNRHDVSHLSVKEIKELLGKE